MAQTFARYCPRCGTPTREKIRVCLTCGLPAAAMRRRSSNAQGDRQNEGGVAQTIMPEPAYIVPPSKHMQPENQSQNPTLAQASPSSPALIIPLSPPNAPITLHSEETISQPDTQVEPTATPLEPMQPLAASSLPAEPMQPLAAASLPAEPMQPLAAASLPAEPMQPLAAASLPAEPMQPLAAASLPTEPMQPLAASSLPTESMQPLAASSLPAEPMQPLAESSLPTEPMQLLSYPPSVASVEPTPSSLHFLAQHIQGRRRTVFLLALLVVFFLFGAGGYLVFLGSHKSQAPIKNVTVHIPFTYAGMNIILFKVQQAQNFIDDPNTANNGMVRIHFQEQNTTTSLITWDYTQSVRLLVLGKPDVVPVYVQTKGKIAPGVTQTSILDFAVPNGGNLSNMSLQLGTANEAQMLIPLTGQAELSQYQPQTHPQHGHMAYFGLYWALTNATTSLSIPNKQAANGMEYLTFTMNVDNMLSQRTIVGSPFDYVRVKIGGQMFNPVSTTLPIAFTSNQIGSTGTVTFLIPQNSASGTLLLISQDLGGNGRASTNFLLAHANKI